MKPMTRSFQTPRSHASTFNRREGTTKRINLVGGGFRGGIRL